MGHSAVIVTEDPRLGLSRVAVNQSVAGTTELAAAVVGKRHKLTGALLTLSADGTIKFVGGEGGADLTGPMDWAQRGGMAALRDLGDIIVTAPGQALSVVTTGGAARGVVRIVTEDA